MRWRRTGGRQRESASWTAFQRAHRGGNSRKSPSSLRPSIATSDEPGTRASDRQPRPKAVVGTAAGAPMVPTLPRREGYPHAIESASQIFANVTR